jgi:hypothetical protein
MYVRGLSQDTMRDVQLRLHATNFGAALLGWACRASAATELSTRCDSNLILLLLDELLSVAYITVNFDFTSCSGSSHTLTHSVRVSGARRLAGLTSAS